MIRHKLRLQLLVGTQAALIIATKIYERIHGAPEQFWVSWTYWLPMVFGIFLALYIYRLRCRTCHAHQVMRGASIFDLRWPDERCYSCSSPMTGSTEKGESTESHTKPRVRTSNDSEFWKKAKRRRNLFFYVWAGWLLAGFPLTTFYTWLLNPADRMTAGMAALATWGAFWYWTLYYLTRLRCVECGEKAFRHPFFLMRHASCSNCGVVRKAG